MNWSAQINRTERKGSTFSVIVTYTRDDGFSFDEEVAVSSLQNPDWLKTHLTEKLAQLINVDTVEQRIIADPDYTATYSFDIVSGGILIQSDPIVTTETIGSISKP